MVTPDVIWLANVVRSLGWMKSMNDRPSHMSRGNPRLSVIVGVVHNTMPSCIEMTQQKPFCKKNAFIIDLLNRMEIFTSAIAGFVSLFLPSPWPVLLESCLDFIWSKTRVNKISYYILLYTIISKNLPCTACVINCCCVTHTPASWWWCFSPLLTSTSRFCCFWRWTDAPDTSLGGLQILDTEF